MAKCKVKLNSDNNGNISSASFNYPKLSFNMNFNKEITQTIIELLPEHITLEKFITIVGLMQAKQSKEPKEGRVRYSMKELSLISQSLIGFIGFEDAKIIIEANDFKNIMTYFRKVKSKYQVQVG